MNSQDILTDNQESGALWIPLSVAGVDFPGRLFLAPMAGLGDRAFRRLCAQSGAAAVVSEMVSAKALSFGNKATFRMLEKDPVSIPQGLQLFGAEPDVMALAVDIVRSAGWTWIDLNAGCPVQKVTKTGAGSALLKDLGLLKAILQAMREHHDGLLSVKVRTGWSGRDDLVRMMEAVGRLVDETRVDMVTVHARTRAQGYSGRADWSMIRVLKLNTRAVVVGNGDVRSQADALRMMLETGCDAVMIGRGALGKPWIFSSAVPGPEELNALIIRHFDMLVQALDGDEFRACRVFRRHLAAYTKGVVGAARIRLDAVRVESRQDVVSVANRIAMAVRGAE